MYAAKKIYAETRDPKKAYKSFKKNTKSSVEAKLLEGLSKNGPNDYVNSLENVSGIEKITCEFYQNSS